MDKQGKILIIDDNEDVLFALNTVLAPYAEKIKVTAHPEKILEYQRTFKPDLYQPPDCQTPRRNTHRCNQAGRRQLFHNNLIIN